MITDNLKRYLSLLRNSLLTGCEKPALTILSLLCWAVASAGTPGTYMRTFDLRDGLPSHSITTIRQDNNDMIWVATWNGIACFNGNRFIQYRSGQGHGELSSNRIVDIEPDISGRVWMLSYDRRVYVLEPKLAKFTDISNLISDKTGVPYTSKDLAYINNALWLIGNDRLPSVRINPSNPFEVESYELYPTSKLRGGASEVTKIEADNQGNEWIFTDKGVQLYGKDAYAVGSFRHVVSTPSGEVCLLADNGKIACYSGGELSLHPASSSLTSITSGVALDSARILVATGRGLFEVDLQRRSSREILILTADGIPATEADINLDQAYADSKGNAWVTTKTGKVVMLPKAGTTGRLIPFSDTQHGVTTSKSNIFIEDRYGNIHIAAASNGIFATYNPHTATLVPEVLRSPEMHYASVPPLEYFYVDRQKNLWANIPNNVTLVSFRDRDMTPVDFVKNEETRSLCRLSNGSICLGTGWGVIGMFTPGGKLDGTLVDNGGHAEMLPPSDPSRPFSSHIYIMKEDSRKNLWIGTKGWGLYRINPDGQIDNFRYDRENTNTIPCDSVYDIYEDRAGNIWLGTYGEGLAMISGNDALKAAVDVNIVSARNSLKKYPLDSYRRVRRLTQLADGTMVVSTTGGLVTFSGTFSDSSKIDFFTTSRTLQPTATSLSYDNVMQTLQTSDGTVYVLPLGDMPQIVTSKNLLHNNLEFRQLPVAENVRPLLNSVNNYGNTLAMVEDHNQNLNIVCESAILVYEKKTGEIYTLSTKIYNDLVEFTEAEPIYDPETGNIWVGMLGGAMMISPDDNRIQPVAPKIIVTGVQFQGESEMHKWINPDKIVVQPNQRNLAISYSAIEYPGNETIQYAYRLDDEMEWTYLQSSNTLYLHNLTAGEHVLHIRSTDSDGVWQDNETDVLIYARPMFSETIWAKILWAVVLLVVLGVIFWIFNLARRNALMKAVHRREHDFFIEASHRLRTPLTLIQSPVDEVLTKENLTDTGRAHLEKVSRGAGEMLGLVNQVLVKGFKEETLVDDNNAASLAKTRPQSAENDYDESPAGDFEDISQPSGGATGGSYKFTTTDDRRFSTNADVITNAYVGSTGDESNDISAVSQMPASGGAYKSAADASVSSDRRVNLLIVEDNKDLRDYLVDILSADYSVTTAINGRRGLEKAERSQPDFIITDIAMPEMDGLTMVHKIKASKALSHIPIIVLSAKSSLEVKMEGLRAGIDDYITKPFSAEYLRERIAGIIAQRASLQQNYLEKIGRQLNNGSAIGTTTTDTSSAAATSGESASSSLQYGEAQADSLHNGRPQADSSQNGDEMTDTSKNRLLPDTKSSLEADSYAGTIDNTNDAIEKYKLNSPSIADADQEMMNRLLKFIEERISDENLRIEELADAVNMGRTVFYGKIKALVGMSPSDFLRKLRMQRAREYVRNSKLNFSQIAYNVGFSDPKYFTKCFKKETGLTPSEYRQHPAPSL